MSSSDGTRPTPELDTAAPARVDSALNEPAEGGGLNGKRSRSTGFGRLRSTLLEQQPKELIRLIGELYGLSKENRRFLEARLGNAPEQLSTYRRLVADCLFPEVYRDGGIKITEAKRAISQYERATGDTAGTIDLMLVFVESGTAFAAEFGYGEDNFFSALENMLMRALGLLAHASKDLRKSLRPRLDRLSDSARDLAWGYGDFVFGEVDDFIDNFVETD